MTTLALDCGSSSVKAAVLKSGRVVGKIVHGFYKTQFDGVRAEIDPAAVLKAIAGAIRQLGPAAKSVDVIALDVMAPSWIAMDKERPAAHADRYSPGPAQHQHRPRNREAQSARPGT